MKETKVSTVKIAATYIGTVVGAGFASGQEILQFFAVFGSWGLWGLILVTVLFIIFGYIIMDIGYFLNAGSYFKIVRFSGSKYLGIVIDYMITFFLFGTLTAMIAGSGALFKQQLNMASIWGNLLMIVITVITVLAGINGVINSISVTVPFLLASAIGISIWSLLKMTPEVNILPQALLNTGLVQNWLWAAVLYISYNTVISIAVLGPLGARAISLKSIRSGAILGGLGLGAGAIAIYAALSVNIFSVIGLEVPMIFIAERISKPVKIVYAIVLLSEIYTTAVGSLYGFSTRFIKDSNGKFFIVGTAVLAFIASQLGFANIIKYLYPIVGYCGIALLLSLLYIKVKHY